MAGYDVGKADACQKEQDIGRKEIPPQDKSVQIVEDNDHCHARCDAGQPGAEKRTGIGVADKKLNDS